jgi:hypothetical protein
MKKLIIYLVPILFVFTMSCSDDSANGVTNPIGGGGIGGPGGGGTNTGSVSFTIGTTQGNQGGTLFFATPNVAVKITQVTLSLPAQQFNEVIQDDGTTVYEANVAVGLQEFTGVESGQQWTMKFEGTIASNNQAFSVTQNYTIP